MPNIINVELQDRTRKIIIKEYDEDGAEIGQYNKTIEGGLTKRAYEPPSYESSDSKLQHSHSG